MDKNTIRTYTLLEAARIFNKKSKLTVKAKAEKVCPEDLILMNGQYYITGKGMDLLSKSYNIDPPTSDPVPLMDIPNKQPDGNEIAKLKEENAILREQITAANDNVNKAWQMVSEYKSLQSPMDNQLHTLEKTSYKYKIVLISVCIIASLIIIALIILLLYK